MSLDSRRVSPEDKFIGEKVRALRLERKITQEELATELGITFQQVQKYEKGTNRVSAGRLVTIAKFFDVSHTVFLPTKSDGKQTNTLVMQMMTDRRGSRLAKAFLAAPVNIQERFLRLLETIVGEEGEEAAGE